ncbi:MAG: glutathione S-transferase family protein [Pseudomonadota bacterium]
MTLFAAKGTIASASAIALEEAGLDYTLNLINFAQSDQTRPDYLAINPKGRVPALAVDGAVITETGAILEYIAALAPQAQLVPSDPMQAARMREMMFYLASTMHVNHAHKMRGHRWADNPASHADMTAKVPQTMTDSCTYVEDFIAGPFVLGDQISLADAYLYAVSCWLDGDGVDLQAFPKITAFRAHFAARPSVTHMMQKGIL